ncbi:MAG: flagellar biosynthesis anti-sigma factor FlgM [Pseudomonadota bacterium]
MKIGNSTEQASGVASTRAIGEETKAPPSRTSGPGKSTTAAEQDKVSLSSTASSLMSTSSADPAFDAEKVERIKQSIADGSYQVNPEAIADKLISNAQEVLSKRPQ